jgi:hypothetical protein
MSYTSIPAPTRVIHVKPMTIDPDRYRQAVIKTARELAAMAAATTFILGVSMICLMLH